MCWVALELCQLLQAQGFFQTGAYDIKCRIPVSFLLASIKSICKGQAGEFRGEKTSAVPCLLQNFHLQGPAERNRL